jgi:hypothetical protein
MDALHTQSLIAMTEVQSSQIHSIGHHAPTLTLAVRFKAKVGRGSLYHYANVKRGVGRRVFWAAHQGTYGSLPVHAGRRACGGRRGHLGVISQLHG